jgi:hypothetical protein
VAETVARKKAARPVTEGKFKGFSVVERDLYREVG